MRLVLLASLIHFGVVGAWWWCDENKCEDCVSTTCRWCKKTTSCHLVGSLFNECGVSESISDTSRCKYSYDPELSLKMLLLSSAAYDPQQPQICLNNALPSSNFLLRKVVTKDCDMHDHDCSGFVAISHVEKAIAVVFRGTFEMTQGLVQFLHVLSTAKTEFLGGKVQSYWKNAFKDVLWPDMEGEVKALVSAYPSYMIWVTGHSLGGALASLASAWIANENIAPQTNIISYTFGMPRVGNSDYATDHDRLVKNSWRVVNYDDTIPHFPTMVSIVPDRPYHHGVEVFYSEVATSVYSPHRECYGLPTNEDVTCSLTKLGLNTDHHTTYFGIPVGTFFETQCVR